MDCIFKWRFYKAHIFLIHRFFAQLIEYSMTTRLPIRSKSKVTVGRFSSHIYVVSSSALRISLAGDLIEKKHPLVYSQVHIVGGGGIKGEREVVKT